MKNLYISLFLFVFLGAFNSRGQDTLTLKKSSTAPIIDGEVATEEWENAVEVKFIGVTDPQVKAKIKYDAENLYIVFLNLTDTNNISRNAEVLIHTSLEKAQWDENCYWFHASYSNCSAEGEYFNWEDCTMNPPDWKANTFPFKNGNNNIEFKISFEKLQITPSTNSKLRIAFKLSDPLEKQDYWPELATISNPETWGFVQF